METVDYFLKGNVEGVPLSWDSIVTALKSDHVGEPALAKHLKNVYTQQGHEPQQGASKGQYSYSGLPRIALKPEYTGVSS